MVEELFDQAHIEAMRPYVQKTVEDLLNSLIAKGCGEPVDLVENFALPVPSYVSVAIRAPRRRQETYGFRSFTPSLASRSRTWRTSRRRMPSDPTAVQQPRRRRLRISLSSCPLRVDHRLTNLRELLKYIGNLVDQRLAFPRDDLISKLATEQVKPGHIEKSDAVQIAFLLLVAGNATMVNMIALVSIYLLLFTWAVVLIRSLVAGRDHSPPAPVPIRAPQV